MRKLGVAMIALMFAVGIVASVAAAGSTPSGGPKIDICHFSGHETGSGISLDELERRHVEGVLEANDWNIQRAAELLGIHRNTLTRKISDFGLRKPD